jgi:hypothetical protein
MTTARVYRRTPAGTAAWQRQDPRVPVEYRRIVGLIEGEIHPDNLRARLSRFSIDETLELLDELVARGLLETVETAEHQDLDFTNSFSLSDLRKAAG